MLDGSKRKEYITEIGVTNLKDIRWMTLNKTGMVLPRVAIYFTKRWGWFYCIRGYDQKTIEMLLRAMGLCLVRRSFLMPKILLFVIFKRKSLYLFLGVCIDKKISRIWCKVISGLHFICDALQQKVPFKGNHSTLIRQRCDNILQWRMKLKFINSERWLLCKMWYAHRG